MCVICYSDLKVDGVWSNLRLWLLCNARRIFLTFLIIIILLSEPNAFRLKISSAEDNKDENKKDSSSASKVPHSKVILNLEHGTGILSQQTNTKVWFYVDVSCQWYFMWSPKWTWILYASKSILCFTIRFFFHLGILPYRRWNGSILYWCYDSTR